MNPAQDKIEDVEKRAEQAAVFLDSEFGGDFMTAIASMNYDLHKQAESADLTIEQKAMLVERAAGVRDVMNWINTPVQLLRSGHFKQLKAQEEAYKTM